ncbi:MAG: nitrile hydratase subunit beta [Pseudomonadota bacterium]
MNGAQDVGGAHGFGPVEPEIDEPLFHAPWEREAFALTVLMGATGLWTLDRSRFTRESLPPALYYSSSYYKIWFEALSRLVEAHGLGSDRPLLALPLKADAVRPAMAKGSPTSREGPEPAFAVGDTVRVRVMNPEHHTRAPRYVRGRLGKIVRLHGAHVFPDENITRKKPEKAVPLYNVAFEAAELWGPDTTAASVHLDLFEPYLDAA